MDRVRKAYVVVRDFFKGRPPSRCQVRVIDDNVDFECTKSRRDIKSDYIEEEGFDLSIAQRVRIRRRGEVIHEKGHVIKDIVKPKPTKTRSKSRFKRVRQAFSRRSTRNAPVITRQKPGHVNWPTVHGDVTTTTLSSLEDLDLSHQPLVRIRRSMSIDAMAARLSDQNIDSSGDLSLYLVDEASEAGADSALSVSVTSEATSGRRDDSGACVVRNLENMPGAVGNYVPDNADHSMHDYACLCRRCFDVQNVQLPQRPNRPLSVFENASAPGDLSHATSNGIAEAASEADPENNNNSDSVAESDHLNVESSNDNLDSLDALSVPSVDEPHGLDCSCPRCFRIGQYDGNDTTDTESDSEPTTSKLAKASNLLPRAPNDPNFETLRSMSSNIDPGWLELYDKEVQEHSKARAAAEDVLREDPTKQPAASSSNTAKQSTLALLNRSKKDKRTIRSYFRSTAGGSSRGRGGLNATSRRLPPMAGKGKKSAKQLQSWRLRQKLKPVVTLLDEIKDRANHLGALVDGADGNNEQPRQTSSAAQSTAQSAAPKANIATQDHNSNDHNNKRPRADNSGSDSEDGDRGHSRQPPMSRSSSYTTIGSGEDTDYSDDDDIRNYFVNNRAEELNLIRQDPLLGRQPREVTVNEEDDTHAVNDELIAAFEREMDSRHMPFIGADRSPSEKLPVNVEQLLHFPSKQIMALEQDEIFERLLTLGAKHHIPLVFLEKTWRVISDILEMTNGQRPIGFYRLRERLLAQLPQPRLHYRLQNRRTGEIKYVEGKHFKKKVYPISKYRPIMSETRANLHELMEYHASCHQGDRGERLKFEAATKQDIHISLYVDGVSPSSTGSMKMICQVVRHTCCNLLLNFNTIVYAKDYTPTAEDLIEGLLADLSRNKHIKVDLVLCDLPERLRLCCLNNFNGAHGCLTCVSPGMKRVGAPGVVWPASTMNAPLRDEENFRTLADASRKTGITVGGHKSKSPLANIPGFAITTQVPPDPMHLFGGLTKFFWERFNKKFLSGHQRKAMTDKISNIYCGISFPSDFKRKFRPIDIAKFRMNEWKQLVALVGIDIGDEFAAIGFPEVADVWHRYTWIVRMLAQGDAWYRIGSYNGKGLQAEIDKLYKEVDRLLGPQACVPNLHILHHMPHYRQMYRLGQITTERAEAFYGVNRRSFAVQSASIGKQVHFNTLLAMREGHACEVEFKFKAKRKSTDMDHLLVDASRGVHWYLRDSPDGKSYVVHKVNCTFYNGRNGYFNWRDAGVLQAVSVSQEETTVPKARVIAKAVSTRANRLYIWTRDLHDF